MLCDKLSQKIFSQEELEPSEKIQRYDEARITTIALGMLALLFASVGILLMGVGTYPPTIHVGLGILPYAAGSLLLFTGTGLSISTVVFTVLAIYRKFQAHTASKA